MITTSFNNYVRADILNNLEQKDLKYFWLMFLAINLKTNSNKLSYFRLSLPTIETKLLSDFEKLFLINKLKTRHSKYSLFVYFLDPSDVTMLYSEINSLQINSRHNCRLFLAALFLGRGWISDINSKHYHFEFRLFQHSFEKQMFLRSKNFFPLEFLMVFKNNYQYFYLKKAINISDILKFIFAYQSALNFEDKRIENDFLNSYQKMLKIEKYNLRKINQANEIQIKHFLALKTSKKWINLPLNQQNLIDLRLLKPKLSLNDLTLLFNTKYKTNYSRSTINTWIVALLKS